MTDDRSVRYPIPKKRMAYVPMRCSVENVLGADSVVVIYAYGIQFHCMDVSVGKASITRSVGLPVLSALVCGLVAAACVIWLPYDRVVVPTQPVSTVVHISSLRLHKAGFAVVYFDGPKGSWAVGHSVYLPPGYYRDMNIPIEYTTIMPPIRELPMPYILKNTPLFVRLFWDNGDRSFDEFGDAQVKDLWGKVYTKHFWMVYETSWLTDLLRSFLYYPESFFTDRLFP